MPDKTKRRDLRQEITWTLALKIFVLFVIWLVWFSAPEDAGLDDQKVASQILSQQSHKEQDQGSVH